MLLNSTNRHKECVKDRLGIFEKPQDGAKEVCQELTMKRGRGVSGVSSEFGHIILHFRHY